MNQRPTASIKYYRWAGEFFGFRIATQCEECDITRAVLGRLMDGPFRDKPVRLNVAPWLNNWWRILWRGAWHAPIIMINGRVFSQGVVPDALALIREVVDALGDDELAARAEEFAGKQPAADAAGSDEEDGDIGITVYFSPACPHCRRLLGYLDANEIRYRPRDVSQSAVARSELQELTDSLALPVIRIGGETISGFDPPTLRPKLGLTDETEKTEGDSTRSPAVEYPSIDNGNLKRTIFAAQTVLRENCESGRTRASRHLHPHQWNWDSGFIARGYLHFDPQQAYREIRLLFQGQWSDGFLPHIVFNEAHLEHFPGPDYWKAERSGRVPDGVHTSGIGQPPVHAAMLAAALELDPDRDRALGFLREMYPRIRALHQFYYDHRDPSGEHLVFLVHPWESGIDNAPLWDEPLAAVTATSDWARHMQQRYDELAEQGNRPKRSYIEKYSYLVERLFETGSGLGASNFSWTAALFLDIAAQTPTQAPNTPAGEDT